MAVEARDEIYLAVKEAQKVMQDLSLNTTLVLVLQFLADLAGIEMDEDAQLLQAIALSMRQESKNEEEEKKEVVEKQDSEKEEKNDTQEPLEKSVLDEFTDNVFPGKWKMNGV